MEEIDRRYQTEALWLTFDDSEKEKFKENFISLLNREYHKRYFKMTSIRSLIGEPWFSQYLESIFFDEKKAGKIPA